MSSLDILQRSYDWLPLADTIVKASVLLGAAALLTSLLRSSSAASRHLVWTCALTAALVLPALSLTLPRWRVPVVTLPVSAPPATDVADAASARMSVTMSSRLAAGIEAPAAAPSGEPLSAQAGTTDARVSWPVAIAGVWAIGATVIFARLLLGIAAVQWLSRRTRVVTAAPWLPLAREMASQLGLTRVTFRRSERELMPMAWGVFRPSVVMPAGADSWPQDRLRIVLLHELAHVRRADCLTHMLAQASCALHWMNPLAWLAARQLRTERERACDDLVLASGTAGPDYADQLLEIARALGSSRFSRTAASASLAMAQRSQLEGRLMSILDPSVPRHGVNRIRTIAATTLALVTIVPLASVQPWAYAAAVTPDVDDQVAQKIKDVPSPQTTVATKLQQAFDASVPPQGVVESVVQSTPQGVVQGVTQGALQGALQGVVQGTTQGVVQGVTQGITQGISQGILQSMPNVAHEVGQANPKPDAKPQVAGEKKYTADPRVVAALTEALKDSDKGVRESAMHALVQMRDPGVFDPLVAALKDTAPDVRKNAAFGLGQLRDKRAVAPLAAALKDSSPDVREQVVFALGQLRDPATVDALALALRDESADVRQQAAFALGQIRDERAVQPLMSVLKDPSADVRKQAVFALGQLRARASVDGLILALKDSDADVRAQAAFALGQTRDPRAIDALTAALKDSSVEVRQQAAFALGQLAR